MKDLIVGKIIMNMKKFANNLKTFIVVVCLVFLLLICLGLVFALINNFDAITFSLFLIVGFVIVFLVSDLISDYKLSVNKDESIEYLRYVSANRQLDINTIDTDSYLKEELDLSKKFLEENPNNMFVQKQKAVLNISLNNYEDAVVDYTNLLSKEPTNKEYICECAYCYRKLNKCEKAKEILNTYYQNLDKDARYYHEMGYIYYKLGDTDLELEYNKRAAELNPKYQDYLDFTLKRIELEKLEQNKT